jgi:hypothetical protein
MTTALNTERQGSNKCLSSLFDQAIFRNKHRSGVHAQRLKHQNPQKKSIKEAKFSKPTAETRPSHVQFEKILSHRIQNTEPNSSCRNNEEGEKKTLTNSDSRKTEQIETDLISTIKGHVRQITAAQTTKQNIHKTKQKKLRSKQQVQTRTKLNNNT